MATARVADMDGDGAARAVKLAALYALTHVAAVAMGLGTGALLLSVFSELTGMGPPVPADPVPPPDALAQALGLALVAVKWLTLPVAAVSAFLLAPLLIVIRNVGPWGRLPLAMIGTAIAFAAAFVLMGDDDLLASAGLAAALAPSGAPAALFYRAMVLRFHPPWR